MVHTLHLRRKLIYVYAYKKNIFIVVPNVIVIQVFHLHTKIIILDCLKLLNGFEHGTYL